MIEGQQLLPVTVMRAGVANGLAIPARVLEGAATLFEGVACFVDHPTALGAARAGGRSVRDLAGCIRDVRYDPAAERLVAHLELYETARWIGGLAAQAAERPFLGLSADMWARLGPASATGSAVKEVVRIDRVNSVDVVVNPAAGGRLLLEDARQHRQDAAVGQRERLARNTAGEDTIMAATEGDVVRVRTAIVDGAHDDQGGIEAPSGAETGTAAATPPAPATAPVGTPDDAATRAALLEAQLATSGLPLEARHRIRARLAAGEASAALSPEALIALYREAYATASAQGAIRDLGAVTAVREPLDRITLAFERLMGLPETAEHRAAPRLSGVRELYDLLTGDWERHGVFRGDRVQLANATTMTMASVVANVLNKALLHAYEARPQWWRPIAYEEDFATMNQVRWITLGGFSDLDPVAEGEPYVEKTWEDSAESAAFIKVGNYVGVTLEMIDRDDVAAVRAIPRKLGLAANRTLSASVAALFTTGGGVGPLTADGFPVFDAENHRNLRTEPLSADEWQNVVSAMFKQAELHSGRALGVRPRYCLVPIELEKTALEIFTSDVDPDGGTWVSNVLKRSSQNVITVPEWTAPKDWAAAADPADLEGLCIGYRFGRAPEIYGADNALMGSMFTHDEMRIKVRFVFAVGVGDWRALHKNNVM
jgi:hypothetical protein